MSSGEIDKFPVGHLTTRYDLVRSAVYKRMDQLGIKPERVGNRAYINKEQLYLLDALHAHIQNGGSATEFIEARGLNRNQPPSNSTQNNGDNSSLASPGELGQFMKALVDLVSGSQPPPDPMKPYSDLENAAQKNWILSTSDIIYLLDISPGELKRLGDRFQDAGFIFTRIGYRRDGQEAWRVTKPKRW